MQLLFSGAVLSGRGERALCCSPLCTPQDTCNPGEASAIRVTPMLTGEAHSCAR